MVDALTISPRVLPRSRTKSTGDANIPKNVKTDKIFPRAQFGYSYTSPVIPSPTNFDEPKPGNIKKTPEPKARGFRSSEGPASPSRNQPVKTPIVLETDPLDEILGVTDNHATPPTYDELKLRLQKASSPSDRGTLSLIVIFS